MRIIRYAAIATATVAALIGSGITAASADPVITPPLNGIVGVGADSLLWDQLSRDYNVTTPPQDMYSWDDMNPVTGAVGDTIVTKAANGVDLTCQIARPDGSSPAITALEVNTRDGATPCIDFALSSRVNVPAGPATLLFLPYAGDAVTWSSPAGANSPVPATLTLAQLAGIYSCRFLNWNAVGGQNAPIVPVLPQNGSGTRADFLLALGGGAVPLVPGACVVNGANATGVIKDNSGLTAPNVAQFDPNGIPAVDDIFPYSIGDYIAQDPATNGTGGHASAIWGHGVLILHSMTTNAGVIQVPTANGRNLSGQVIPVINRNFEPQLQHNLYTVVRNAANPPVQAIPAHLAPLLAPAGWLCASAAARADTLSYGFFLLGAACG
jgi:hypothetical protein